MNLSLRLAAEHLSLATVVMLVMAACLSAQEPTATPAPDPTPTPKESVCKGNFFKNILCDQKAIWLSPRELRAKDARWLAPLALGTGNLIATDRYTAAEFGENHTRLQISNAVSHAGAGYGVGSIVAAAYLIGRGTSNDYLRDTGKLAAEALIDAAIVDFTFKEITRRPRPLEGGGRGRFLTSGHSHPSGHSAAAWSVATVFACRYQDKPVVHYGAYMAASAVSISRFTARRHFLSDILVGGALGYGVGRYVCHMDELRNPKSNDANPHRRPAFIPSSVGGRFDRRTREYGVALAWDF